MNYAELLCQSNFSFLQGASHPEELLLEAERLGYSALALTDECSLAGVVRAYAAQQTHQLGIKLIIGSRFRFSEQGADLELVLLCPDRRAYAELCRVITNARRRCPKGHYRLDPWDLRSLRHCLLLWLPQGQPDADGYWGPWLAKHHGPRLWLGLRRHLEAGEAGYRAQCEALAQTLSLTIAACGEVLMHHPDRLPLQQLLTAIRLGTNLPEAGRRLVPNAERSLRPLHKLNRLFRPEWLAQTQTIAERCQFSLSELRYEYPAELVPKGQTPFAYLCKLVEQGLRKRFPEGLNQRLRTLVDKELALIEELGYAHFFLTIHDLVCFAQSRGILYQGRGSAANSVVCYCLDITAVDPRHIEVLFERFLSKERKEPPDIDVDFEHQRREEVIQYIYTKYGRPRAALAATVIRYRFKSAIKDLGKALGLEAQQLDFLVRHSNRRDPESPWETQLADLGLDPESNKVQQLVHWTQVLCGFPRHLSQHVGGFVIASGPLYELVPLENAAMAGRTVIQWDKDDIETLGLLKVDVLALGMLTALRKSFDLIREHQGQELTLAGLTQDMADPAVYQMIQRAETIGVFQIESRAQMSMLPRLKPRCYYDLVIQIAIVRPGPIQGGMVHPYLQRRNGTEAVSYPSREVEAVLGRTMGVPIFQEQVIKLAMVAAGFSGGEADQLRRAMARWKQTGELRPFHQKLVNGMEARGYHRDYAERIYQQICGFGEYGFPESHSASFALLAYASAWLKCHYPEAFYTALLNSQPMGFYSPSQLIQDAQRRGVEIRQVCINQSQRDHSLESGRKGLAIRLGFRLVKQLSETGIECILSARVRLGSKGFSHLRQLQQLGLTQPDLAALASSDSLHALSQGRRQQRWQLMDTAASLPLFQTTEPPTEEDHSGQHLPQAGAMEELLEDYASLNLSLKGHPVQLLDEAGLLGSYVRAEDLSQYQDRSPIAVAGLVTGRQSPGTASGVTFITLEDHTGNSNVIVWRASARAQKQAYLSARLLKVHGILEREGSVVHVIAGRLEDLSTKLEGLNLQSRDFH